jgi:hypothetical protein
METEQQIEMKTCTKCTETFPATNEYFYKQKKYDEQNNPYYDLTNWCKVCYKKKARDWAISNPDKMKEALRKQESKESRKKYKRAYSKKQRENGYYKQWQQENAEKIYEYNSKRTMNKKHDITDEEWYACLDYFNNSCAYCGLSEEEQFELYNENFHMEHVDHNGSNYIDNCVPSCTSCNVSKFTFDFNDWYNENNEGYSKRRYNKIINWLTRECFKVLNLR